jgi:hypothetical protein
MRIKFIFLCLLAAVLFLPLTVSASERRVGQHYSVTVRVECLEEAVEVLRALPGFDLFATVSPGHASFTRRVDAWAFRHVQEVLRGLGDVTHEQERVRHLNSELAEVETRLAVLSQEMERLTVIMSASTTLNILNAVDMQLTQVSNERDWLTGRRNTLLNEARTTTLDITITERWVPVEGEVVAFGTRVAESFISSWRGMVRFGGNLAVFIVRVSLPLGLWMLVMGAAAFFVLRHVKKTNKLNVKTEGAVTHE